MQAEHPSDGIRMKVVFLDQSGQLGGAELMLLDLIPQMQVQASVLLLEDGPFHAALRERGIPVRIIGLDRHLHRPVTKKAGLLSLLRVVPGFLELTGEVTEALRGADVIYANTPKAWIIGAVVARRLRVPLVCHLHDILSSRHFSTVNRLLMVKAANLAASAVIANSHASAAAFTAAGGRHSLVRVVPNGFDLAAFSSLRNPSPHPLYSELGPGHVPLVAMVGRLAPWKGQHVFLAALAQLPGIHGVILGEALFTAEDHAYADHLPELAVSLGCADRVHFLGFRRDVRAILCSADIVVHCSVEPEPFGRVIVEAMLCGRPVIVAGEGGAAEIVEHGATGLHHRPGDADSLAACLRRLLDDPATAGEMALAAAREARARYSLVHVAESTLEVITSSRAGTAPSSAAPLTPSASTPAAHITAPVP